VEPLRPLLQLARGLGTAQHQDAEDGGLAGSEAELLVEQLPVLRSPAPRPARDTRPAPPRESLEGVVDLALVVPDDRIPIRRLVAGETECVEREWVLVGGRPLLLQEAAEHPDLDGVGVHGQSVRHPSVELAGSTAIERQ